MLSQGPAKHDERPLEYLRMSTANLACITIGQRKVRNPKAEHQPDRAIRNDGPGRQMNTHRTNKGSKESHSTPCSRRRADPLDADERQQQESDDHGTEGQPQSCQVRKYSDRDAMF